jgi:hypothetical protein
MRGISQWVVNAVDTDSVTVSMPVARASISLIADSMVLKPSCTRRYKMLPLSVSLAPP